MENNLVHHIVSTNTDNLHIKSGIKPENLTELHGNIMKEYCKKCKKVYIRDYNVLIKVNDRFDHLTGKMCEEKDCDGELMDNTINFGEYLDHEEYMKGKENSEKTDLSIILGSSMKVNIIFIKKKIPFYHFPFIGKKKNKNSNVVMVNLQKTDFDDYIDLRVFSKIDDFMEILMKEINLE
jgi:NAD-dependent SIR2 family protein deacetylase